MPPGHSVPPVMGNHTVINGDISHVRPRLPGGFPVNRDSAMTLTPSDGYYSGGGLQSTQKGKYGNRDMKTELQDITVEMDRITLGELLEEGKLTFQGVVGIYTMYIFYTIIKLLLKSQIFIVMEKLFIESLFVYSSSRKRYSYFRIYASKYSLCKNLAWLYNGTSITASFKEGKRSGTIWHKYFYDLLFSENLIFVLQERLPVFIAVF